MTQPCNQGPSLQDSLVSRTEVAAELPFTARGQTGALLPSNRGVWQLSWPPSRVPGSCHKLVSGQIMFFRLCIRKLRRSHSWGWATCPSHHPEQWLVPSLPQRANVSSRGLCLPWEKACLLSQMRILCPCESQVLSVWAGEILSWGLNLPAAYSALL